MSEIPHTNSLNHDKDHISSSKAREPEEDLPEKLTNLKLSVNTNSDPTPNSTTDSSSIRARIFRRFSISPTNSYIPEHKFWDTQLVTKLTDVVNSNECGPIDPNEDVSRVKKNPIPLPNGFEWISLDINDEEDRNQVYKLLSENYVEDGDALFRFDYKREFLIWALTVPNYNKDWQIGVRVSSCKTLIGYITAVPVNVNVVGNTLKLAEVNFLCIHKKFRSKRLAPVLIKEITRRVNLCGIWQAIYTAGIVIPRPIAKCRYWHRPLDIKRLIASRFSGVGRRMTISRAVRIYKVNDIPNVEMRPMEGKDVLSLHKLLTKHLQNYKLYQEFDVDEVEHQFMPREDIIQTFVKTVDGQVTDMLSYYSLPSSVINNRKVHTIRAAYSFYNIATTMSFKSLMEHAIYFSKSQGYDVYNALDLMENSLVFKDLKFGMGDGDLHYYMFNYRVPDLKPSDVGIVLL
ncbi:Glycylpeptide N-tetradecanoyltransferase [Theileria parva strain Muguga]|uniref:Glycylpeptide N-tetradecanoyltransferase n=1 Tax=Theileria parva TaxID=5875 RepID=Q4N680_THEPA|nr:Glycylpeptide N-tetradecanoyltransferase [Theileria parva strain Muguga]EAN32343.1 Glycylpeptide N-tetradecanoyltransferase [Theileria parva strain Muguga]|eukprot:XP_764626.1 N-myristoyltransferase [Theileria parva strain Muguga]